MKRLQFRTAVSLWRNSAAIPNTIRFLAYSNTRTLTACFSSSAAPDDTLYRRLSRAGDPSLSMVPILEEWAEQGRSATQEELQKIIRQFRKFRRFKHALEVDISTWMTGKGHDDILPGDMAVQLDLTSKVHGLAEAENYFYSISNNFRNFQVYGALLNCYADAKSLEKAEAVMQKMRELDHAGTLSYNVMLKLYSRMGEHEKLEALDQEMVEKGINRDRFTFIIRINAYASSFDMERMEKVLLEADPVVGADWNAYAAAANGYLKAGATGKAVAMLKKAEPLVKIKKRKFAYQILLSLYAKLGIKDEVHRMWNLHKKIGKLSNISYLCMISSLMKLDDLDGAEKILTEWEARKETFDFRIPNLLISAYCMKGLLGKAESLVNRLMEGGVEPNASTWSRMALGYHKNNQMAKAVEATKKAILTSHPGWKPHIATLASCLDYLKGNADMDTFNWMIRSVEEKHANIHDTIMEYAKNGNPESQLVDQMGKDDQSLEVEMFGSKNDGMALAE
ncbi:hypothetical protein RJ639_027728 [Escallonia herrerae]|uniref:Pentatricopeptide repeat-containing protein n=1 Tax=Escallonia herrerae TaxID=1293975 RepID=A0AA89BDP7_9ASTE|nr:hypothetical protein RJ639_027728 [Escallonia herrerae]